MKRAMDEVIADFRRTFPATEKEGSAIGGDVR